MREIPSIAKWAAPAKSKGIRLVLLIVTGAFFLRVNLCLEHFYIVYGAWIIIVPESFFTFLKGLVFSFCYCCSLYKFWVQGGCGVGDKCVKDLQLLSFNVVDNSHNRSLDHCFGRLKEELDNTASTPVSYSVWKIHSLFYKSQSRIQLKRSSSR